MAITKQASGELKSRVNNCIDRLSDRDTVSMAANELEAIARTLQNDAFAPFLNCLSSTDSSEKSPVRRQCVRLISVLSTAHGDALSPHVSRMISTVLRRLRDPDSAVQAACVDAVASITAHVNSPPFTVILKPLVDTLFHEQDLKPQIGAALCLAAAVEAAPEPDLAELRKLLPRALKLVKSDSCKAKPALLSVVGSIVSSDCVKSKSLLSSIVSTAVDFLSSEDWAARKEAAEVLEKVAVACRSLAAQFNASCIAALESRRFDKVKLVREKMNRALEIWKDLPSQSEGLSSPNVQSDASSAGYSPLHLRSPGNDESEPPQLARKVHPTMSPASSSSSSTSSRKSITGNENNRLGIPTSSKLNPRKGTRAQVVPFNCNDGLEVMMAEDCLKDKLECQTELEDMSLIQRQLQQIENQQSNLLDLLQKFMGSSQKGMSSLEQRVDGLEKVLDVMSHDLAISSRGVSTSRAVGNRNICCMLPGAEFLSPKFWRKAEGHTVNSRFVSSLRNGHGVAPNASKKLMHDIDT